VRSNLRSRGLYEFSRIGSTLRASVSVRPFLGILAERTGLIAKKGPPRLSRPSAWCGQVTRYGGLRDVETEHEKLAVNPWSAPEKVLTGHPCDQTANLAGTPLTPAAPATTRSISPHRRPDVTRQRRTVSGWPITRLPRQSDHQRDSKIQNRRSKRRKQGRRVRLRCSTAIWWRSAIDSNSSEVRVRGSLRVTETAPLFGFAMKAGYPMHSNPPVNPCGLSFEKPQLLAAGRSRARVVFRVKKLGKRKLDARPGDLVKAS
jgi:hypothetical protein